MVIVILRMRMGAVVSQGAGKGCGVLYDGSSRAPVAVGPVMSLWQRQKNWWSEVVWKPKKAHSLEQLK